MLGDRDYMRPGWQGGHRQTPFGAPTTVTMWIVIITIGCFILQLVVPGFTNALEFSTQGLRRGHIWRPFSYILLHAPNQILHILFNMFVLWMFGRMVEARIGARSFITLYVISGVIGGLIWATFSWSNPHGLVGASGSVMGVLAAAAYFFPHERVMLLIPPIPMKLRTMVICLICLDLLMQLTMDDSMVAHTAHLGGVAAGLAYVWLRYRHAGRRQPPRPRSQGTSTPGGWRQIFSGGSPKQSRHRHPAEPDLRWVPPPEPSTEHSQARDEVDEEEVDRILDKIGRDGIRSLTREERRILRQASEKEKGTR